MKAEILTIHFGVNYGSALQAYALYKTLHKWDVQTEILNYIPKKYNIWYEFYQSKKGIYPFIIILSAFVIKLPFKMKQRKIFERFLRKNLRLSRIYHNNQELRQDFPQADLYIAGSDQIWNFDYNQKNDFTYFLDFLPSSFRKISYAASIGKEELTKEEINCLQKYLSGFSGISLREDKSMELLESMGINSEHVLDPTMLVSKNEWESFLKRREKKESYVLIYVMDYLYHDLIDIAEVISKKLDKKIYMIAFKKIKDKRIDKQFIFLDPKEFLGLIWDASYVVTNSFHGVAFSINFNRQFIAVGKEKYNVRMQSLLRMFLIEDRFVSSSVASIDTDQQIDYSEVNRILKDQREKSLNYLENFCKNSDV